MTMFSEGNLMDVQVLIYLAEKSKNYEEVSIAIRKALVDWQENDRQHAFDIISLGLQANPQTAQPILDSSISDLRANQNLIPNLMLFEHCAKPAVISTGLVDLLWDSMRTTDDGQVVDCTARALIIQIQILAQCNHSTNFRSWWPAIVDTLKKGRDKRFKAAGSKTWSACISYLNGNESNLVIVDNSVHYFDSLEKHVSMASKFALQILGQTLKTLDTVIDNEFMRYDPNLPGITDAWARYISLVEILGIDTSVHQTMDSLPDFAALSSPQSPIPSNWIITLINVGAVNSNTEGIRTLVIQSILEASDVQLSALAKHPVYVAQVSYAKFLYMPSFVFINSRCLHAERLERFTQNFMKALLDDGIETLRRFTREFAKYLLEHCHGVEAPRVLIMNAIANTLPLNSSTINETGPLLAAAKATVATYTSKAMADLYLETVEKLIETAGPPSTVTSDLELSIAQAVEQLDALSFIEYVTFKRLSDKDIPKLSEPPSSSIFESLLDVTWHLEYCFLYSQHIVDEAEVRKVLSKALYEPEGLNAEKRKILSGTVEMAFDYLAETDYGLCESAFAAFNESGTRLSASKAYKRSNPRNIPAAYSINSWIQIQEATLRVVDRELHHEFIDLLTTPGAVNVDDWPDQQHICFEIVDLSDLRRNLLVPLALGLQRFQDKESSWVMTVMARIFAFICSKEYAVQLEESVAKRFGVYEKYWGPPESNARGIAAAYLQSRKAVDQKGSIEATVDTLAHARLNEKVTGSLDNIGAHKRVLYYQISIILQDAWPHEMALDIMKEAKTSLENEANPPVRVHAEWLIGSVGSAHLSLEFTSFVASSIDELDVNRGIPPRVLGSLIRVSMLSYFTSKTHRSVSATDHERLGVSLIEHLLPLATSNKAVVRHRAVSAFYISSINNMTPDTMKELVNHIARINSSGVRGSGYQNEAFLWDVTDTRLGPICGGICSIVFDRKMPNTLEKQDFDLSIVHDVDFGPFWDRPENTLNEVGLPELVAYREAIVREAARSGTSATFSQHIQTKSGTFDVEYKARRTSLIVVATLCDKPVNLGAICRLSDASGVQQLIVRDKAILDDQQFKTTALTAEKWIPIDAITEADLSSYLRAKKSEGYTLVGIEQTDTSKMLRSTLAFPEKTLLMMGHEKQGIPAEILMLLDSCVEIEQLGYVRSMNIQTATAVVVHAYNQNHGPEISRVDYLN